MRTGTGTGDFLEPPDASFEEIIEEEATFQGVSPLNVHVDVIDLIREFDGDETRAFEFIGKLKDLLA